MLKKFYIIHSLGLAKGIMNRGIELLRIDNDKVRPNKQVFIFEDTLEFRLAMSKAINDYKSNCAPNVS